MKYFIPLTLLLSSFSALAQDAASDELLNQLEPDVSELVLDAPSGDETFSQPSKTSTTQVPVADTPVAEAPVVEAPVAEEAPPIEEAPLIEETATTQGPVLPEVISQESPAPTPEASLPVMEPMVENTSKQVVKQDDEKYNPRTGHWVATVGVDTTNYRVPFSYTGTKKRFSTEDRRLTGGRLGFGREAYLGAGFLFNARLEGYYVGTLFNSLETASPEFEDVTVAGTKDTGQMYGGDAIGHLGWMFDFNTKNPFLGEMNYMAFELFVEAGIGRGKAINGKSYFFGATTNEQYKVTFEDDFTTQIVSAGFNIHSRSSGSFLYVKASQVTQTISERKIRGSAGPTTGPTPIKSTLSNPVTDPMLVISVGGGFKF